MNSSQQAASQDKNNKGSFLMNERCEKHINVAIVQNSSIVYIVCKNHFFQVSQIQPVVQLPSQCLFLQQNPNSLYPEVFLPAAN